MMTTKIEVDLDKMMEFTLKLTEHELTNEVVEVDEDNETITFEIEHTRSQRELIDELAEIAGEDEDEEA